MLPYLRFAVVVMLKVSRVVVQLLRLVVRSIVGGRCCGKPGTKYFEVGRLFKREYIYLINRKQLAM
jgi:hypothetical protein